MRRWLAGLVGAMCVLGASCGRGGAEEGGSTRRVVCTTGMIGDLAARIGGARVSVTTLMGSSVDPHLYKATRSDIAVLSGADAVFYNGLMLEGKMGDALTSAARGRMVVAVTERLEESYLLEPPEFAGHYDPHVWMDPMAWARAAQVVRDSLIELDPAGEAGYRERAGALIGEIEALDAWARERLASVPVEHRVLITAHDAFNYFARAYGYEVVGIQGISTDSEAGLSDIERIVGLIVDRRVGAVFVETTVSERNVRALIEGARARGHAVRIGGTLFSDAMGGAGTHEGTYIGMIDHNVTTIVRALGGDAPETGMVGRLEPMP